jgi:hypothetical protein
MLSFFRRKYFILIYILLIECTQNNDEAITIQPIEKSEIMSPLNLKIESRQVLSNDSFNITTIAYSTDLVEFPDLAKFQNNWFVTFRLSDAHVAEKYAHIIVLKSADRINWVSDSYFTQPEFDLRDPKFSLNPENDSLFLHFHSTNIDPYGYVRNNYTTNYINSQGTWGNSSKVENKINNLWLWRPVWHNNMAYVAGYYYNFNNNLILLKSANGYQYQEFYTIKGNHHLT